MSKADDYRKRLYGVFLKDTPIKYESVTDQQWTQMANTYIGRKLAVELIFQPLKEKLATAMNNVKKALSNFKEADDE